MNDLLIKLECKKAKLKKLNVLQEGKFVESNTKISVSK